MLEWSKDHSNLLIRKNILKGTGVRMSKRETYEAKTEELLAPIVENLQLEVYDVDFVKEANQWYLRVFIDKPEGVTIQDCETVSRAMSEVLDKEDFISEEGYIFEVSSPGLGRTLKKDKHFAKSIGQEVEVKTYKPIDKQKEFTGILKAYNDTSITIEIEGNETKFEKTDVALVRLTLDF